MIIYELCLVLKVMPKSELAVVLNRTATAILNKSGIIRNIENLGTRDTPHKISEHGLPHRKASYFLMEFNAPPKSIEELKEEYSRDIDIIRRRIYKKIEPEDALECTLEDELQPAPYRKGVQDLLEKAKRLDKKPRFSYNSGLDYYPFQK